MSDTDYAGFRDCEYCGCHTNARVRACCSAGRDSDLLRSSSMETTRITVDELRRLRADSAALAAERAKLDATEAAKQSAEHQLEMEKAGREDDGNSAMMRIKKLSVALDAFRSKLPKTTDGVTVLPGMTLHGFQLTDLNQPKPIAVEGQVIKVFADGFRVDYQIRGFGTPEWYSTAQARDAAVAALSRQEGGQP
jgi:hypothetical protein